MKVFMKMLADMSDLPLFLTPTEFEIVSLIDVIVLTPKLYTDRLYRDGLSLAFSTQHE